MKQSPNLSRRVAEFALVAIAACGSAQAVYLNPQGLGEALVYPYYTVNGGQDTLFTLTNQGRDAKAVKVRFLEAYNSRDVLDINVYLAVGDVWTAAVVADGDGAKLVTSDPSCTVPDVVGTPTHSIAFKTSAFDGSGPQGKDGGPTGISRVREGHVEMIEMGTVKGASEKALSPTGGSAEPPNRIGGPPTDCASLHAAWTTGGYWTMDAAADLTAPSGGLTGSAMIVNVARGTVQGYVADALADFHAAEGGLEHTSPDALKPNLASATSLVALTYATGAPSTLTLKSGIDAVTAVFMSGTISNEFWTTPALGANSEWVITFPTRRFYTDPYYVGANALAPFERVFPVPAGEMCFPLFGIALHDANATRAGNVLVMNWLGDPTGLESPASLCYSTQVVAFRQNDAVSDPRNFTPNLPSRVLASHLVAANFQFPFESGWARIGFSLFYYGGDGNSARIGLPTADGQTLYGRPVTGFLAAQFVNGSVEGALANYTLAQRHRTDARCEVDSFGDLCLP